MAMYFSNELYFVSFPMSKNRIRNIGCDSIIDIETLAFYLIDHCAFQMYGHKLRLNVRTHNHIFGL